MVTIMAWRLWMLALRFVIKVDGGGIINMPVNIWWAFILDLPSVCSRVIGIIVAAIAIVFVVIVLVTVRLVPNEARAHAHDAFGCRCDARPTPVCRFTRSVDRTP
jgi:hypothetical protein